MSVLIVAAVEAVLQGKTNWKFIRMFFSKNAKGLLAVCFYADWLAGWLQVGFGPVWKWLPKENIKDIERVQKSALRLLQILSKCTKKKY